MTEELVKIDYSLDEYSEMLRVQGRCTLGNKTVYGIYVFSKDYAKRKDWCGLYVVEDYLERGERCEVCATLFKFPINYIELVLGTFLRTVPGTIITELVFCDMYRCYPTLRGLYPLARYLENYAMWLLRRDVIIEFHRRFGGVNVIDYIFHRTPARVFYLSVMFPRKKKKFIVFIPTPDPAKSAIEVSKMQLLAKKVHRQIDLLSIGVRPDTASDMDGLRNLGITLEDIEKALRKIFGRDKPPQIQ